MGYCRTGKVLLGQVFILFIHMCAQIEANKSTFEILWKSLSSNIFFLLDDPPLHHFLHEYQSSDWFLFLAQVCCTGTTILQGCCCCSYCLWYNKPRDVQQSTILGEGSLLGSRFHPLSLPLALAHIPISSSLSRAHIPISSSLSHTCWHIYVGDEFEFRIQNKISLKHKPEATKIC